MEKVTCHESKKIKKSATTGRGRDEVSVISSGVIKRNYDERPLDVVIKRSFVRCMRKSFSCVVSQAKKTRRDRVAQEGDALVIVHALKDMDRK